MTVELRLSGNPERRFLSEAPTQSEVYVSQSRATRRNQAGNVQLFSSLVAAITSRSSFGPGTGGLEVKTSH